MHWIDYASPHSVREAADLLAEHGGNARVMAGGTDLLVVLRAGRMNNVNLVVDIKNIPELNEITYDPEAGLTLGAAVPCYKIYSNHAVAHAYPGIVDVTSLIGGTLIQGRASLGGNLCNAAPSGDSIPVMIALGAVARIAGPDGDRTVPVVDFCTAPGKTVLGRGELLVSLSFPAPDVNAASSNEGSIPLRAAPSIKKESGAIERPSTQNMPGME